MGGKAVPPSLGRDPARVSLAAYIIVVPKLLVCEAGSHRCAFPGLLEGHGDWFYVKTEHSYRGNDRHPTGRPALICWARGSVVWGSQVYITPILSPSQGPRPP